MQIPPTDDSSIPDVKYKTLTPSESRYQRIFETAQDGILLLNFDTAVIEDVNPYLINMLGYSVDELMSKKLWEVGEPEDSTESKERFAELQSIGYIQYEDLPLQTKAGQSVSVEFVSNSYQHDGIKIIQCNIRDIRKRKEAELLLKRHINLYSALTECNKAIAQSINDDILFDKVCEVAVKYGEMKLAWIGIVDFDTGLVKSVASYGDETKYVKNKIVVMNPDSPFSQGPTGIAIRENRPYWCQDFINDPITIPWRHEAIIAGFASSASLPLVVYGVVIGALSVYSEQTNAFDEQACNLLVEMASVINIALDGFEKNSERERMKVALKESEQFARSTLDALSDHICVIDKTGIIIAVNKAWRSFASFNDAMPVDAYLGTNYLAICDAAKNGSAEEGRLIASGAREVLEGKTDEFVGEYPCHSPTEKRWFLVRVTRFIQDNPIRAVIAHVNITQRVVAENLLLHLAHFDSLTGLPNRVLFRDRLNQALAQAERTHLAIAVMFIDLDGFKTVNDTLGHLKGDRLLQLISERISGCLRSGDIIGRLGGDEFAIILTSLNEAEDAGLVALKMMAAIAKPATLDDTESFVTGSIGITIYPNDGKTTDILIQNADTAMYRAKEMGGDNYQYYLPAMNALIQAKTDLGNSLRRALELNELFLHYQPQLDLKSGQIIGVEALIRWNHPKYGLVSPSQFIPIAEETGLTKSIGEWVLQTACAQNKA